MWKKVCAKIIRKFVNTTFHVYDISQLRLKVFEHDTIWIYPPVHVFFKIFEHTSDENVSTRSGFQIPNV